MLRRARRRRRRRRERGRYVPRVTRSLQMLCRTHCHRDEADGRHSAHPESQLIVEAWMVARGGASHRSRRRRRRHGGGEDGGGTHAGPAHAAAVGGGAGVFAVLPRGDRPGARGPRGRGGGGGGIARPRRARCAPVRQLSAALSAAGGAAARQVGGAERGANGGVGCHGERSPGLARGAAVAARAHSGGSFAASGGAGVAGVSGPQLQPSTYLRPSCAYSPQRFVLVPQSCAYVGSD
jgi:hypothetical protein